MSKETYGLFSPFSSSPLSPAFSPFNWLNFDRTTGAPSPQIGIECLSPHADDIIHKNNVQGNERNEWEERNSVFSNPNYNIEAQQNQPRSSHLMSMFSSPLINEEINLHESEDEYEYQYHNFALPPPARSEHDDFIEGMGGMDDLDSEFIEFNISREQRDFQFSNVTNFVKSNNNSGSINNNNPQSQNFDNSVSFATSPAAGNRLLSKSPLSFNILSNPNSPIPQPSLNSNYLSTPSSSVPIHSPSLQSQGTPSPSQSPSSINSTSPPNGNQFVEHPIGEHPSRTLFVRNINSNVDEADLRSLFEAYGPLRSMYTQCKHRGFVMISYFDIRHSKNAMRNLQGKLLRRRKLDIHYSIPKDNPSEKDQNQGTLVVFNLDPSISTDELRSIFGVFGEIKEIRETPNKKHHKFIEFYDVRDAEKAMKQLNKTEIKCKKIKIEPSRPGGRKSILVQPSGSPGSPISINGMQGTPSITISYSNNNNYSSPNLAPTPCSSFAESDLDFYLNSNQRDQNGTPSSSPLPSPSFSSLNSFEYSILNENLQTNQMQMSPGGGGGVPHSIEMSSDIASAEDFSNLSKSAPLHSTQLNFTPTEGKNLNQAHRSRRSSVKGPQNPSRLLTSPLPSPALDSLLSRPPRSTSMPVTVGGGKDEEKEYSRQVPHSSPILNGSAPNNGSGSMNGTLMGERKKKYDDKSQFMLNLERVRCSQDVRTTLMIKNIPNKYTQKMLLSTVDDTHKGLYDFFYLPIDFKNKCNVGYAFINFIDPQSIISFHEKLHNTKWEKFNSEKVCNIAYARIQGKESLISHFQNSSLMCEDKKCRPIIFHSNGPNMGQQAPFPVGPNVRVRPKDEKPAFTSPRIDPLVRRQKEDFRTNLQNKKVGGVVGGKVSRTRSFSSIK